MVSDTWLAERGFVRRRKVNSGDGVGMCEFDLLIRAGRVVCTASGLDGPGAVAVLGDRIVAAGADVSGTARRTLEFPDGLLLPGLVDFHAHPARSGSKYGVDPDREFLPRGVTTVLSQGDAGADNWAAYRDETVGGCRTRVRLAINLSKCGERDGRACFEDSGDLDIDACTRAVADGGESIWGISVNLSRNSCRIDPRAVMHTALQVAALAGKPLLFGMRNPSDWPIREQLELLRPGDVVTYLLREGEWSIAGADNRVLPEVRAARERGILFDACHGMQSFSFRVAEAAIGDGFLPDTISTDQYAAHLGSQPPHDLPRTMSKFVAAGMTEQDMFARVGARPAELLGLRGEVGRLTDGSCADLTVLAQRDTAEPLFDCFGESRVGRCWEAAAVVRTGVLVSGSAERPGRSERPGR